LNVWQSLVLRGHLRMTALFQRSGKFVKQYN
jgi:hypothetical protein